MIDKTQSIKVNKAATIWDNAKRTFSKKRKKTTRKKGVLYEIPETGTTTQGDEGYTQLLD